MARAGGALRGVPSRRMADFTAHADAFIAAPPQVVWDVLTSGEPHPEILAGARIVTDWALGAEIRWIGEWDGKTSRTTGACSRSRSRVGSS